MNPVSAAIALLLLGVGPTAGLAQWRPPDPECRKWALAASADPGLWTKFAECGAVGGQALAAVLRGEAARADTIRLGALERVLLQSQDSAVFRTALNVAWDSTAAAEGRIVALLVALGQSDPAAVRRRSSGFAVVLADTVESPAEMPRRRSASLRAASASRSTTGWWSRPPRWRGPSETPPAGRSGTPTWSPSPARPWPAPPPPALSSSAIWRPAPNFS